MRDKVRSEAVIRLHKLEGQLEGIERMLASGRTCTDVLTQISSARSGLDRLANILISEHLEDCLVAPSGDSCCPDIEADQRVNEVRRTLDRFLSSMENSV